MEGGWADSWTCSLRDVELQHLRETLPQIRRHMEKPGKRPIILMSICYISRFYEVRALSKCSVQLDCRFAFADTREQHSAPWSIYISRWKSLAARVSIFWYETPLPKSNVCTVSGRLTFISPNNTSIDSVQSIPVTRSKTAWWGGVQVREQASGQ